MSYVRQVGMLGLCLGVLLAVFAFAPGAQARPFVYVASNGSGDVSQFEGMGGGLSPLSPPTAGASPGASGVAVSPDGNSVYVTNYVDDTISQYGIASNGTLSFKAATTETTGSRPGAVVVRADRGGGSVYVVNGGAFSGSPGPSVSQYTIAPDGTLSPKSPASVPAGTGASEVSVTPDVPSVRPSLYVTNTSASSISQYAIAADGTLSPESTVSAGLGNAPDGVAVRPDAHSASVANGNTDVVSQYTIAADGTLSPKSPFTVGAGRGPVGVAVSRDGASAYVTNTGDPSVSKPPSVSQYTIAPDGTLSSKSPATVAAGNGASAVALSPDGGTAYVTNFFDNTVSRYKINPLDGTLSAPIAVAAGSGPGAVAVTAGGSPPTPDTTSPGVAITSPAEGASFSQGQAVAASYSCADPDGASDVTSCAGPVAPGARIDTGSVGAKTFTVSAADRAGNRAEKTVHYTVTAAGPGPRPGPGPGPVLKPGLAVAHSPAKVTRGKAGVLLTCPRGTSGCSGTLTLSVHQRVVVRRHGHRSAVTRTVTVGRARFSLAAGTSRTVGVSLSATARRSLAGARGQRIKVTATIGRSRRTITLVQTKPRKRRKR